LSERCNHYEAAAYVSQFDINIDEISDMFTYVNNFNQYCLSYRIHRNTSILGKKH